MALAQGEVLASYGDSVGQQRRLLCCCGRIRWRPASVDAVSANGAVIRVESRVASSKEHRITQQLLRAHDAMAACHAQRVERISARRDVPVGEHRYGEGSPDAADRIEIGRAVAAVALVSPPPPMYGEQCAPSLLKPLRKLCRRLHRRLQPDLTGDRDDELARLHTRSHHLADKIPVILIGQKRAVMAITGTVLRTTQVQVDGIGPTTLGSDASVQQGLWRVCGELND